MFQKGLVVAMGEVAVGKSTTKWTVNVKNGERGGAWKRIKQE